VGASNGGTVIAPVLTVSIVNGGTGYTSNPSVTIDGVGGGFAVNRSFAGGSVATLTISNAGIGYVTAPTITFSAPTGTPAAGATATATVQVPSLTSFLNGNSSGGNVTSGNSGNITQVANSRIHVEGTADFVTFNGNIVVGNNGNSFGRVQASTGGYANLVGSGAITIVEDSGLRVGNIATNGTASLTSRFGPIIEDDRALVNITANGTTGLVLNAPASSIQLGNATGNTTGNITAASMTAAGSAQIYSIADIVLGATSANSLTVTANSISQSAPLSIFGLSTFNATGFNATTSVGGGITLTNGANNFGPVSLTANRNGNIAVTEANTLNLRSVNSGTRGNSTLTGQSGNGTLTLTSVNGDIVDTGLGGVKAGGVLTAVDAAGNPNTVLAGSGVVTLTATNGNIIINDPTSDVVTSGGLAFNANNVNIEVLGNSGATLLLGANGTASAAHGNLTARSSLGNIGSAGSFRVDGVASFETGNGNITINQPNTGFGSVRFIGNQVQINEAGSMDILTGSSAFGPATLVSGGSINIVPGVGSVTFGNAVTMNATGGDITLRQMQSVGTLTLSHTGTANLSSLSKATDLNGRDPIDLGTGPYVPPNQ
jgi:hypothetical protein